MILVLENEVQSDYRYLGPEIQRLLPDADYHVYPDDPIASVPDRYDGVVLGGSTASVYEAEHAEWVSSQQELVRECIDRQLPLLGICFGHQLVNAALGGTVERDRRRATFVEMELLETDDPLLDGLRSPVPVLHGDLVVESGSELVTTARTSYDANFCTRHPATPLWTVQFHPEFTARVADRPSDWESGEFAFSDTDAATVLTRFGRVCSQNS